MAVPALPQPESVGERIRYMRRRRDRMTQRELARRTSDLGVPMSVFQLNRIEADQRQPSVEELLALAVVLDVSVSQLGAREADYPALRLYRDESKLAHIRWSVNTAADLRRRSRR